MTNSTLLDYIHMATQTAKQAEQHVQNAFEPVMAEVVGNVPMTAHFRDMGIPVTVRQFTDDKGAWLNGAIAENKEYTGDFVMWGESSEESLVEQLKEHYSEFLKLLNNTISDWASVGAVSATLEPVKVHVEQVGSVLRVKLYTLIRYFTGMNDYESA